MKRCPECRRDYYDDSLSFCLEDGTPLVQGSVHIEMSTAILPATALEQNTDVLPRGSDPALGAGNSIAVLPFINISNDVENEYFCDGLAEELLNALSKIEDLKVAARTSAFSFKGKNVHISEIGRLLGVNTVLEGSVRKAGDRIRITAQLINARDGYHLWSETYDREMKDIFDVQDEITLALVEALKVKLLGHQQAVVLKHYTESPDAYDLYLRGISYFTKFTPEFFQKAIDSYEKAIEIDPQFAAAYASLAEAYSEMSFFDSPQQWMPKAKQAARRAIEIDDRLGNAHNSLGVTMMYYDRDFAGAEREFRRAIELDPGSAHIHMWYGWFLGLTRRFDEAIEGMRLAQRLDPLSHLIGFGIGAIYLWAGQVDVAIDQLRRLTELNRDFPLGYTYLADAFIEKGDIEAAVETVENAAVSLDDPICLAAVAYVYAKAGRRDSALTKLDELESSPMLAHALPVQIAQVYLGLGDEDRAIEWVERAIQTSSVWLTWLGVEPAFHRLRSNPRFAALTQGLKLP